MEIESCVFGENQPLTGYQRHSICRTCEKCPPHPIGDSSWVAEMEGMACVEELKENFREELHRQLIESPRRKTK
jgi:hypothetical protein